MKIIQWFYRKYKIFRIRIYASYVSEKEIDQYLLEHRGITTNFLNPPQETKYILKEEEARQRAKAFIKNQKLKQYYFIPTLRSPVEIFWQWVARKVNARTVSPLTVTQEKKITEYTRKKEFNHNYSVASEVFEIRASIRNARTQKGKQRKVIEKEITERINALKEKIK